MITLPVTGITIVSVPITCDSYITVLPLLTLTDITPSSASEANSINPLSGMIAFLNVPFMEFRFISQLCMPVCSTKPVYDPDLELMNPKYLAVPKTMINIKKNTIVKIQLLAFLLITIPQFRISSYP